VSRIGQTLVVPQKRLLSWNYITRKLSPRHTPSFCLLFDSCHDNRHAEKVCRKTRALHSFQISQEMSMIVDDIAFLSFPLYNATFVHHSSMDSSLSQSAIGASLILEKDKISFQILLVNLHLYRGKFPQFGHPLF
jgi:hypothetical protein